MKGREHLLEEASWDTLQVSLIIESMYFCLCARLGIEANKGGQELVRHFLTYIASKASLECLQILLGHLAHLGLASAGTRLGELW